MTGHVVARAAGLLVVEVPCVFIVASNLLCTACQQQQRQRQHPLLQLHFAGLCALPLLFPFFFYVSRGGEHTADCPNLNWIIARSVLFFVAAAELETVFDSVC